jgi:hypothetical protein
MLRNAIVLPLPQMLKIQDELVRYSVKNSFKLPELEKRN